MSSSSLTAAPSSDAPLTDRTLPAVDAARPVARRTYGRRREASPIADADGPSLDALFTSSDLGLPLRPPSIHSTHVSPSKALLNRFSTSATGWMTSLDALGADADIRPDGADNEVDDEEELKREMARLRHEARGSKSVAASSRFVDLPAPTADIVPRKVAIRNLHATSSTSTPTTLPTSPLRSSPPPQKSSDPVMPVSLAPAVAPTLPALATMFDESSDVEREESATRERSVSPISQRSTTPTPAMGSRKPATRSMSRSPLTTPRDSANRAGKAKKNRLQAFMANLESEAEHRPKPDEDHISSSPPAQDTVNDFFATLRQDDDDDGMTSDGDNERLAKQTSSLSVALFDDGEDDEHPGRDRKGKKVKVRRPPPGFLIEGADFQSLAKKEIAQMHKDVAAAKRGESGNLIGFLC